MFIRSFANYVDWKFHAAEAQSICKIITQEAHLHFTTEETRFVQITNDFIQNKSIAKTVRPNEAWKCVEKSEDLKKMEEKKEKMLHALLCTVTEHNITTRALQACLHVSDSSIKAHSIQKLRKCILNEMSQYLPIHHIYDGIDATYVNPIAIADLAINRYCKDWEGDHQVTFVLSGDGRTSGNFHSLVITLKLVLSGENPHSTDRIYKLAVSRGTERYGSVKAIFDVLRPFLITLKSKVWILPTSTITPKMVFCSDLKFLLLVLGLKTTKSLFPCP
jgi:hypothetical protein